MKSRSILVPLLRFVLGLGVITIPLDARHMAQPRLAIALPPDGATFVAGEALRITTYLSDSFHGNIDRVEVWIDGELAGEAERSPYTTGEFDVVHHFHWMGLTAGEHTLEARAFEYNGAPVVSAPVRVMASESPNIVALTVEEAYAIEGAHDHYGAFRLTRTGDLSEALTVFFSVNGTATREEDYWLEEDPCVFCLRPALIISGNEITFHPEQDSLIIGVMAQFEFNMPPGFIESPLENVRLEILPVPVAPGTLPPYMVAQPGQGEVFIVDATDSAPGTPVLALVEPAEGAEFVEPADVPIRLISYDPEGSIPVVTVFANGQRIGYATDCPPNADCFAPSPGRALVLEFYPDNGPLLPGGIWPGVGRGDYALHATGARESGELISSKPVQVKVRDAKPVTNHWPRLFLFPRSDGAIQLTLTPALAPHPIHVEASADLEQWEWIGEFSPGGFSAFFLDQGTSGIPWRFYRAVGPVNE